MNDEMRVLLTGYLEEQFAGRPDLLAKVVPSYPPGSKRMLRDNGVWAGALTRDNVELVTDRHRARSPPSGVVDGRRPPPRRRRHRLRHRLPGVQVPHPDAGHRSRRRRPPRPLGRRPRRLPRHHRPGLPQPLLLYGPNTNIVINGSIIYFSECGVRYILDCLRLALQHGGHALEVRDDVHDAFNERIDAENRADGLGHARPSTAGTRTPPATSPRTGRSPCSSTGSAPARRTPPTTSSSVTRRSPHPA